MCADKRQTIGEKLDELVCDLAVMEMIVALKLSPEEIRQLYVNALELNTMVHRIQELVRSRIATARSYCKHENKKGYVCPDCGLDTE